MSKRLDRLLEAARAQVEEDFAAEVALQQTDQDVIVSVARATGMVLDSEERHAVLNAYDGRLAELRWPEEGEGDE